MITFFNVKKDVLWNKFFSFCTNLFFTRETSVSLFFIVLYFFKN